MLSVFQCQVLGFDEQMQRQRRANKGSIFFRFWWLLREDSISEPRVIVVRIC